MTALARARSTDLDNVHWAARFGFFQEVAILLEALPVLEGFVFASDAQQLSFAVFVHLPVVRRHFGTQHAADTFRLLVGNLEKSHDA